MDSRNVSRFLSRRSNATRSRRRVRAAAAGAMMEVLEGRRLYSVSYAALATPEAPGGSPAQAIELGDFSSKGKATVKGTVGGGDDNVFFTLSTGDSITLKAKLSGLKATSTLDLDAADGTLIASSQGRKQASIQEKLGAGQFYIDVESTTVAATPFKLQVSSKAIAPPKRHGHHPVQTPALISVNYQPPTVTPVSAYQPLVVGPSATGCKPVSVCFYNSFGYSCTEPVGDNGTVNCPTYVDTQSGEACSGTVDAQVEYSDGSTCQLGCYELPPAPQDQTGDTDSGSDPTQSDGSSDSGTTGEDDNGANPTTNSTGDSNGTTSTTDGSGDNNGTETGTTDGTGDNSTGTDTGTTDGTGDNSTGTTDGTGDSNTGITDGTGDTSGTDTGTTDSTGDNSTGTTGTTDGTGDSSGTSGTDNGTGDNTGTTGDNGTDSGSTDNSGTGTTSTNDGTGDNNGTSNSGDNSTGTGSGYTNSPGDNSGTSGSGYTSNSGDTGTGSGYTDNSGDTGTGSGYTGSSDSTSSGYSDTSGSTGSGYSSDSTGSGYSSDSTGSGYDMMRPSTRTTTAAYRAATLFQRAQSTAIAASSATGPTAFDALPNLAGIEATQTISDQATTPFTGLTLADPNNAGTTSGTAASTPQTAQAMATESSPAVAALSSAATITASGKSDVYIYTGTPSAVTEGFGALTPMKPDAVVLGSTATETPTVGALQTPASGTPSGDLTVITIKQESQLTPLTERLTEGTPEATATPEVAALGTPIAKPTGSNSDASDVLTYSLVTRTRNNTDSALGNAGNVGLNQYLSNGPE